MLRNVHESSSLEIIEFIVRKINRDDEHSFNYESLLNYMELVDNLLTFDSSSTAQLKLSNKITKYLLPILINSTIQTQPDKVILI